MKVNLFFGNSRAVGTEEAAGNAIQQYQNAPSAGTMRRFDHHVGILRKQGWKSMQVDVIAEDGVNGRSRHADALQSSDIDHLSSTSG